MESHNGKPIITVNLYKLQLILLVLLLFPAGEVLAEASCQVAKNAMAQASRVRGLKPKEEVPCKLQNKGEVEAYLKKTIDTEIPAEKMEGEEIAYKFLGLIPTEFSYKQGIIDLYTGNIGGYYDPKGNYYVMASWMPDMVQGPIAIHELVHALQDQHFNLDQLLDQDSTDSDALIARSALAEGDATAVMIDNQNLLLGKPPLSEQKDISMYLMQNLAGVAFSDPGGKTPHSLKALLIFPYVSGLGFAHELLLEGGYSRINKAFKNLPVSTEQILHPEIYLKGDKGFLDVPLPKPPESKQAILEDKASYSDRYGEFFISTLLASMISPLQASKAAEGWGGG